MKRIMLGDIHGREWWLDVVKRNKDADEFIFFGDYFDPYWDLGDPYADEFDFEGSIPSVDKLISNFNKIVEFKESNGSRVKLLLGNHDLHYIADVRPCSRYNPKAARQIKDVFLPKLHLFDVVYQFDNVLCTHAGISCAWLDKYRPDWEVSNVAATVRELFNEDPRYFDYDGTLFDESIASVGRIYESPFWIRPQDLEYADIGLWKQYIQVYGHTKLYGMPLERALSKVNRSKYYNVDTLWGWEPRYLCCIDGEFSYNRVQRRSQTYDLSQSIDN